MLAITVRFTKCRMQVADAQLENLIKITKVHKGSGVACVFSNQLPHVL